MGKPDTWATGRFLSPPPQLQARQEAGPLTSQDAATRSEAVEEPDDLVMTRPGRLARVGFRSRIWLVMLGLMRWSRGRGSKFGGWLARNWKAGRETCPHGLAPFCQCPLCDPPAKSDD